MTLLAAAASEGDRVLSVGRSGYSGRSRNSVHAFDTVAKTTLTYIGVGLTEGVQLVR